ncbi:S8 family serine peptidase [Chitinophaga parva]|nr:S8 family serine peptidase [Chitinophaga parva]
MQLPMMPYRLLVLLLFFPLATRAQAPRYVISFTDKGHSPYSISNPSPYLSARALERRQRMHLDIDSTDLPVTAAYTDSLLAAGNVKLLYTSRWFNQAIIQTSDAAALQKILQMPFVKSSSAAMQRTNANVYTSKFNSQRTAAITETAPSDYGNGYTQIHLHNGGYLHNKGYTGQGMLIAVLDEGFPGVDTNAGFAALRNANGIVQTFGFSTADANVYASGIHGAECLSIMAAHLPGQLIGTAPDARYALYQTEEAATEQPIEENNWAAAAERADSLGADIISSSLGYSTFDNPAYDYTYADMNGRTSLVSKAATMAARKGMIVVNANGNEGSTAWHYLTTPADADSILAVGAVTSTRMPAAFSGYGPAADGRIKPDVAAMGQATALLNTNGSVVTGNGTSFATPVMAGLVACLWQAYPQVSNIRLLQVIRACSDHYTAPDSRVGYGIPDFKLAFDTLAKVTAADSALIAQRLDNGTLRALPNPFTTTLHIYYAAHGNDPVQLALYNALGQLVRRQTVAAPANGLGTTEWNDTGSLAPGPYFLHYVQGSARAGTKLIKLNQ